MAGVDVESPVDPRTRVVVVYGTAGGLTGSSNWRIEKPLLAIIQDRLDRSSVIFVWLSVTMLAVGALVVSIFLQTRLRRRATELVARNQGLLVAEERARLARDIHDHLGADLTQLAVQLEQAHERLITKAAAA